MVSRYKINFCCSPEPKQILIFCFYLLSRGEQANEKLKTQQQKPAPKKTAFPHNGKIVIYCVPNYTPAITEMYFFTPTTVNPIS